MTSAEIAAYVLGLCLSYFGGLKWGAAVKFIRDLGASA